MRVVPLTFPKYTQLSLRVDTSSMASLRICRIGRGPKWSKIIINTFWIAFSQSQEVFDALEAIRYPHAHPYGAKWFSKYSEPLIPVYGADGRRLPLSLHESPLTDDHREILNDLDYLAIESF